MLGVWPGGRVLKAHTQGEVWGALAGGVSRYTPTGVLEDLAGGVSRPTPMGNVGGSS